MGGTAGRTTLNGEGLQHEDGHSHILASTVPNLLAYDPAYAYEIAIILQDGMRRMYHEGEDIFYYLTLYNENYVQPAMPEGVEEGILQGMYKYRAAEDPRRQAARPPLRQRHHLPRGAAGPGTAQRENSALPPTCGVSPATRNCAAKRSPPSAATCSTRTRSRRRPTSHAC